MPMELKDTLNLPQTQYPMRGDLVKREPQRLAHWEKLDLYRKMQAKNASGNPFILHDGPPFTNGDVHIGTALNKILKDTILHFKNAQGFRTPYVPGWDCHGLPIEHRVSRELRDEGKDLPPAQIREACAAFSAKYIETQTAQFKRLGVLADWQHEYKTMNPAYEAQILRTFAAFVEQDLVYRSKKPVYWSIPCETALAEAEIEYQEHVSPSIWVKFQLSEHPFANLPQGADNKLYVVIWTTTPWTLPANLAVTVHPNLDYVVVSHTKTEGEQAGTSEHYLVAAELAEQFIKDTDLDGATIGEAVKGAQLEGLQARHPFIDRAALITLADYVTTESGTGCVHTAPGHGLEDYQTGLKYGLEVYCPLDDKGAYVDDGQIPAELVGISVLETAGKCPANSAVLQILTRENALLKVTRYKHQYPHCWRSKTPVVFRAMDQWFVGLDRADMRQKVLQAIDTVQWLPSWGENRIRAAVENRPDWCISRQRSWGVPIPAFYDADGNALLDAAVIRALADKVESQGGTNIWFTHSAEELLSGIEIPAQFKGKALTKGADTLDVWIDSGCSHRAVLQTNSELAWPADLYLEGSDQHRGWFQSSIWTGVIADGAAPYKSIITHGFIVDEKGEKISKSKGAMSSDGWVAKFGADIMRLWVSSQDFRNDIRLSENHFKLVSNVYRGVRNTLRFLIGNLHDFDPATDTVPAGSLDPLDQWAMKQTANFVQRCEKAYNAYEFHLVYQEVDRFVGVTLSRVYHDILKDRLYTYGANWPQRRSSQTAIREILLALLGVIAPILAFTADEAYCFFLNDSDFADDSIHLRPWPQIDPALYNEDTVAEVAQILALRDAVNAQLELQREKKVIGQSLDAKVTLSANANDALFQILQRYEAVLPEFFIVSAVQLVASEANAEAGVQVLAEHADGVRCPRSWRWVPELVQAGEFGKVSPRDRDALQSLQLI